MTQTPTTPTSSSTPRTTHMPPPTRTGGAWGGWIVFAGIMLVLVGIFQLMEGFVAVFENGYYLVSHNGLVVHADYTGWGWLHLILGVLVLIIGAALLREDVPGWARGTAIVLVALNAVVQLSWLPAYPIWSIVMIVLDVLIIGALVAIGDRAAWSN